MIFDNYGVLDKYGIEMLDDILTSKKVNSMGCSKGKGGKKK